MQDVLHFLYLGKSSDASILKAAVLNRENFMSNFLSFPFSPTQSDATDAIINEAIKAKLSRDANALSTPMEQKNLFSTEKCVKIQSNFLR